MTIFLEKWAAQNGTYNHKYYHIYTEYKHVFIMTSYDKNSILLVHPEVILLSLQAYSIFDKYSEEVLEPRFSLEMF